MSPLFRYRVTAFHIALVCVSLLSVALVAPTADAATLATLHDQNLNSRARGRNYIPADTAFSRWLTAYGRAWSQRDPDAMTALFASGATYREDPFGAATNGRDAIRADWVDIAKHQKDIHFSYEVLSANQQRGVAHWAASFVRRPSKEVVQLDGILMATFNAAGQCTEFREWWHRRTHAANALTMP